MEQAIKTTSAPLVASEIELVYKSKVKASQRPCITSSSDAYTLLLNTWEEGKMDFVEQFVILLLNRANKVLGLYKVSSGGVTGTIADPRLIFTAALMANSCGILLCHNHPSGAPRKRIGVIHKTFMSMFGVNIVDREAGTWIKTAMFLKPSPNVVNGCPTIQRTAIQSNTMATQGTVDRCPAGWNTRLKIGIECSYRKYFTEGSTNQTWIERILLYTTTYPFR